MSINEAEKSMKSAAEEVIAKEKPITVSFGSSWQKPGNNEPLNDGASAVLVLTGKFLDFQVKAIEKRDSELTSDKQIERLTKSGSKYLNLNPYEVLQVPTDANEEVIKIAYKRLSILVHPDKNLEDRERAQKAFEALSKANKTLKDGDQVKKIKHVIEEAEATVEKQLREKRKEAKKLNIDSIEEDTDPEKYYKFKRAITAKLFADYEIRRLQLEERTQSERKREREAEIAEEEEVKAKKEWQKQWDVSLFFITFYSFNDHEPSAAGLTE
eukprot:gene17238-8796_t